MGWVGDIKLVEATVFGRRVRDSLTTLAFVALVAGCTSRDDGLTKSDYRDLVERTPPAAATGSQGGGAPPIPELQPILAAPPPPALEQRLVSVNVPDDQVPLKDVLIELARKVGVDLDLDPKISGGVIIYAKDRPFSEVIDRICDMANLRYTFKNNVLRIELDTMYNHDYHLDVLNTVRKASTNVATSTDVFSSVAGGGGGGGQNNSTSTVASASTDDPWTEVEDNLKQILANSYPYAQPIQTNAANKSADTASATPAPAVPVTPGAPATPGAAATTAPKPSTAPAPGTGAASPAPGAPPATSNMAAPVTANYQGASNQAASGDQSASGTGTTGTGSNPSVTAGALSSNPLAALQQALYQQAVGPNAAAAAAPAATATGGAAPAAAAPAASFSVSRSSGIISVFGTSRQQKLVRDYLKRVVEQLSSQVLIEAKVVEVDLNDQFKMGIDWNKVLAFSGPLGGLNIGTTAAGTDGGFLGNQASFSKMTLTTATTNPFQIGLTGANFSGVLQFIQGFGTTRTLSSPRVTVMNNQTAVLKVAQNQVYFSITGTITPSTVAGVAPTATFTSTLHTVPIGVVMTVQPSIDVDHGQVTMNLRPTVSVHASDVSDPSVALELAANCGTSTVGACSASNIANAVTNSNVPVVDVREMDSMVTLPSGDIVVMGGLMQSNSQKQEVGVPGAADVPLLGNLFKARTHETDVTELVIFLKATIVKGRDSIDWADKDLYQRYMQDPRPLAF